MARARTLFSPLFLASAIMLAAAAAGLDPAIGALTEYYSKDVIPLRLSFDAFDVTALPSFRVAPPGHGWTMAPGDVGTSDEMSIVFEATDPALRQGANDLVMLFVTYYTDPRDQIPHTPEVCYRQAGAVVRTMRTVPVPTIGLDERTIDGRYLEIDQYGSLSMVVYAFVCNGRFYNDREAVRFALGWPGDKYTYFSKVEVITRCPPGRDLAVAEARCTRMLAEAIAVLVADHYPTKEDLKR